jgi:TonB family protein
LPEPPRPPAPVPQKGAPAKKDQAAQAGKPRRGSLALAAAAVVVAAIGGGLLVLRLNQQPAAPVQQQPPEIVAQAAEPPADAGKPDAHKDTQAPAIVSPPAAAVPPPRNAVRPQATAKAVRPVTSTPEETAPPPAAKAPVPAPPPESAPPPVAEVVAAPAPAAPAAPVAPFFETTDVNEAPQVAKRVEPQLPQELRGRPVNEILVVRILVSQSGHPFRVSLLRRSKAGPSLDSAVIEAVNRWAFLPAKRRGEPVSCWLNMGVPVGQSN